MRERMGIRVCSWGIFVAGLLALPVGADDAKPAHSAITPVPREGGWMKRHEKFVEMAKKGGIDVLFLGDSITDAWGGEGHESNPKRKGGEEVFAREFEPLKAANFGIGGDRTQHVLWRLQNGELDGIHPKVVMLMIGTNNSNTNKKTGKEDNTAGEIADGIAAIVKEIHKRSPRTKVLLLGVFPRGEKPNPQRDKLKQVNTIIARLDEGGKTVKYLDIGGHFVQDDGSISKEVMYDFLHFTPKGYQMWADAVKGPILELLGK
jgi:lysophospholipase L1-like esterase